MMTRLRRDVLLGVCVATLCVVPVWADNVQANDDAVARLEARLAAQQQELDALRSQVSANAMQDVDQARNAEIRRQIREVLSEREFRDAMMPSTAMAGYDKGFFIRSSDDNFLLRMNGLIQFRWTHYNVGRDNHYLLPGFSPPDRDRTGFDVARGRLIFSGHAHSPAWTYRLELASEESGFYDTGLRTGWVDYKMWDELHVRAGLMRLASTRAQMIDDGNLQMVDRPLSDAVFGAGYGLGVRFWGECGERAFQWYIDVVNSVTEGERVAGARTITTDETWFATGHDNIPALLFRAVWNVTGDADAFATQADHAISENPAASIGFHYMFNEDDHDAFSSRIPFPRRTFFRKGGFGLTSATGLQTHQFGLDTAFKYMGFSATAEYVVRILDVRQADGPPFTPLFLLTGDDSTNAQHGAYVQCGYFLPLTGDLEKKIEVVGRVGGMSALSGGKEGVWEYAAGVNYYIVEDSVKLQMDVTKVYEAPISSSYHSLANVNDNALIWRMQLQFAF